MIISNERITRDLADSIVSRTYEVYAYDMNIENYEMILATTLGVYPDAIAYLESLPYEQAIKECPEEYLDEIAELAQHARVSYLIRTEVIERKKANSILQVLISRLNNMTTEEEYNTAIAEAVARRG